jgi:hypothetical protein
VPILKREEYMKPESLRESLTNGDYSILIWIAVVFLVVFFLSRIYSAVVNYIDDNDN